MTLTKEKENYIYHLYEADCNTTEFHLIKTTDSKDEATRWANQSPFRVWHQKLKESLSLDNK